ncbi:hypothetical protein EXIGLDRAFT_716445 [Exidia glandulosa HHB12029]|uniref:F-box domain-containing protein n=1 Tax=Exidia glandulosa HHB12029 TaxID=1314781 RepID=A0A165P8G6_EXIGL|nr:hypothetical protein EXIGLDRAFT_716445 [Exidia glandulosa HHB12029]
MTLDPNRYADPLEATSLRARITDDELELEALSRRRQNADQALDEAEARFREVEVQYNHLKALRNNAQEYVKGIQRRQTEQVAAMAKHRAFFHPVRKVPLHILGEIFALCLVQPRDDGTYQANADSAYIWLGRHAIRRRRRPFAFARVCKRWRQASLSNPQAWAYLEIPLDDIDKYNEGRYFSDIDLILSRSRSAPLVIRLHRTGAQPHSDLDLKAVTRIVPAMHRCYALQIDIKLLHEQDVLLQILTAPAPGLVYASLEAADPKSIEAVSDSTLLPDATRLKVLSSRHIFVAGTTSIPTLRKAKLRTARPNDVLHLLRTSPDLEDLTLVDVSLLISKRKKHPVQERLLIAVAADNLRRLTIEGPKADAAYEAVKQRVTFSDNIITILNRLGPTFQ